MAVSTYAIPVDEIVHDVLRGLQGAGDAAIIPAAVSECSSVVVMFQTRMKVGILAESFPPPSKWRSLAFATFAAGASVGAGLGIILGGVFV